MQIGDEVRVFGGAVGSTEWRDAWCRIARITPRHAAAPELAERGAAVWLTLEPIDPVEAPVRGRNSWEVKEFRSREAEREEQRRAASGRDGAER